MSNHKNIAALIMIGGLSKRMGGGIKSLYEFNDKSIFNRVLEKIKPQVKKILINCNEENKKIEQFNFPIIRDIKKGHLGPLAGIHTGMDWLINHSPDTEWLITIPGDTPFIPSNLVSKFKDKMSKNLKIIIAKSEKKTHPIIGAWHISLFSNLDDNINNGTRKILSLSETHPLESIKFHHKNYDPFFNINTKKDMEEARVIENNFL